MIQSKIALLFMILLGISLSGQAQIPQIAEDVQKNIQFRVDNGNHPSIIVGVISSKGRNFFTYGSKALRKKEAVDENTVYEIGSISKTFTGILLADMVIKKELKLDDPLQSLLPEGVEAPGRNGESIKLVHLANHRSSLPRMPTNFSPANPANPFADYSEAQLFDFLNGYILPRDIGSQYEYSNYAMGLLGYLLAAKKGLTYEALLQEVITKPLGLQNTAVTFSPAMRENLAPGHHNGLEVQNWDLPTLAGAGGIRSTASDMLDYLAANMGLKKTKLYPALSLSHKNSGSETNNPIVGLGWHSQIREGRKIVWHNGRTGGYASFTGFIEGGDLGVVVLSNSTMGVDDIGLHVLDPSSTLDRPIPSIAFKIRGIIQGEGVEAAKKAYRDLKKNNASDYDFRENQLNTLGYTFMEDNRWKEAKAVFELNIEAYPNSSNVYDSYGEALMNNKEKEKAIENYKKSLALNPANSNALAMLKKMGVDTEDMEKEVIIDEATLLSYVGKYELAPDFILSVTKRGKQMSAQATGQGTLEIFPKSQNRFYYKVVEAQLQFNQDEAGQVKSVTLFQGGREIEGKKLPE